MKSKPSLSVCMFALLLILSACILPDAASPTQINDSQDKPPDTAPTIDQNLEQSNEDPVPAQTELPAEVDLTDEPQDQIETAQPPEPTPESISAAKPTIAHVIDSSEPYPVPSDLTTEGLRAYENIAEILLTSGEINPLYDSAQDTWRFVSDTPGLYSTCRTFENAAVDAPRHVYFFSCVYQTVPDFDLLTGDIGIYQVLQVFDSAFTDAYPAVVYGYQSESGAVGIDRLIQAGRFIYITGVEISIPLGESLGDSYSAFLDRFLYESGRLTLNKALAAVPEVLDFAENALSRDETEVETVILSEGELAGWYIGEPDEFYDDGLCRTFYHEEGPPPVLINCVFQQSRFSVWDWLDYYQELDFIDMTFATRYEYQAPYFIFMDFTSGGYPRYAFAMESEDIFINLDLIIPRLMPGTDFEDSFTESIDNVIQQAVQISLDHQSGQ